MSSLWTPGGEHPVEPGSDTDETAGASSPGDVPSLEKLSPEEREQAETLARESTATDLTILGMHRPELGEAESYSQRLNELADVIGTALLVHSADGEELLETEE